MPEWKRRRRRKRNLRRKEQMQALLENGVIINFVEKEENFMEERKDSKAVHLPVYSTTNYAMFTPNPLNRQLDYARVRKIARLIEQGKNLLRHFPIKVDANLMITDGHHRHAAAKIAKVELFYEIDPDFTIELAADAVGETKNWSIENRLHHFVMKGVEDYVRMNNTWKKYDWLPVSTLVRICSSNGYQPEIFKSGNYKADRIDFAKTVIEMAEDFKPYFDGWKTSAFINALMQIASTPGYSHRRMMDKMRLISDRLHRHARSNDYLDNFTMIYNYKVHEENTVIFRSWKRMNSTTLKSHK